MQGLGLGTHFLKPKSKDARRSKRSVNSVNSNRNLHFMAAAEISQTATMIAIANKPKKIQRVSGTLPKAQPMKPVLSAQCMQKLACWEPSG